MICGVFWLKSAAVVIFMLCNIVSVEWLLLEPCYVVKCVMLSLRTGGMGLTILANERSEIGLYEMPRLLFLFEWV